MKARHKAVPAVYLVLERDGKILLMLRQNTGWHDGDWAVIGGHVEAGELVTEAMIREAEEEIGIVLRKEDLEFVHVMYRGKHDETGERADFFFVARHWAGSPKNREPEKCVRLEWFPKHALPPNVIPHERLALENIEQGVLFSEYKSGFFPPR